ncbi:MAG: hypothetical protein Q9162_006711 [Coniocarpon cinnabarinum]
MADGHHINQRRSYYGHLCTIRYIGPVQGTSGSWLGVEWDDGQRGKHAGFYNGMKYFKCASSHPTPTSFVRPSRPADPPRNLLEAVKHKYASDIPDDSTANASNDKNHAIHISGKEVEEVGFDRIRRQHADFKELRIVVVDGLCIQNSEADAYKNGKQKAIAEALPRVQELDLSRNLFEVLSEIMDICQQLTRLTSLRLDGNRLANLDPGLDEHHFQTRPFTSLKSLSLNDTLLRWEEVASLASAFPSLVTLSASGNEYTELTDAVLPAGLTNLSLERNKFTSLEAIGVVKNLADLQCLSLGENPITSASGKVTSLDDSHSSAFPASLVELNLPYCSIEDWSLIDGLDSLFPGLTSLRVSHNPLYDSLRAADGQPLTPDDGYMLTVARLSQLTRLNFSSISPRDRLDAGLYYLSQIRAELSLAAGHAAPQIIRRHPRYSALCRLYGQLDTTATSATPPSHVDPRSLAAALATVSFKIDDSLDVSAVSTPNSSPAQSTAVAGRDPQTRQTWDCEIPRSYTIYKLTGSVARHYGLRPLALQLELECPGDDTWPDGAESDLSSEGSDDDGITNGRAHRGDFRAILMQRSRQVLTPLTRSLDTWVEGPHATIVVCARAT